MPKEAQLTALEWHLLRALSTGASNKHIARDLGKSEFTIRNQLSTLFKKIDVANRTQAAFWCREYSRANEPVVVVGTSVPLLRLDAPPTI